MIWDVCHQLEMNANDNSYDLVCDGYTNIDNDTAEPIQLNYGHEKNINQ